MTRKTAAAIAELPSPPPSAAPRPACLSAGRCLMLVGLMGSGKTTLGRQLAARFGMPFHDVDSAIEDAAGQSIRALFAQFGETAFRARERQMIDRLLSGPPSVLATGGGAFLDPQTRAMARRRAVSVWLQVPLPVLVRRITGHGHRPLLMGHDPATVLASLQTVRDPLYAEADLRVVGGEEPMDTTVQRVIEALQSYTPPRRVPARSAFGDYEIVIGPGLLARAGAYLAPLLPQKRCVVVTDDTVAALHLPSLLAGLAETGIATQVVTVPPGEASKSLAQFGALTDALLAGGIERQTTIIALGGGVVGDLAGFAAASVLRGLPLVQIPTTLLAQVDSSVGGKTGINTRAGKNLLGAFHGARIVLADTDTLATLPPRELRAGYAEIIKAGLIGDADFFGWCEARGPEVVGGQPAAQAEAVARACAFKAAVVEEDEREQHAEGGRALLNLGHSFAHALEAACGYDGTLLHGEAVALGLGLAFRLSAKLGLCKAQAAARVVSHIATVGLPSELRCLGRSLSAAVLIGHMRRDKKVRDGAMRLVLVHGIGQAFTSTAATEAEIEALLRSEGCQA